MKKMFVLVLAVAVMMMSAGALAEVSLDQAKQIALDHAGVAAENAVFTKAHPDYDDGRSIYDIEFFSGTTEYELDVDAATGEITEFETEEHALAAADGQIDEESAKQIALAHAGLRAEDVTFRKAKLDRDDGRMEYEIEFVAGGMEYEYDIDAATGRILKFDADRDD